MIVGPVLEEPAGWVWRDSVGDVEVRFTGKGGSSRADHLLSAWGDGAVPSEASWCTQIHSAEVLSARPGNAGRGDALHSDHRGLALSVVTADCVPILLASESRLAAIHAGWRGIVQGVVPAGVEALVGRVGGTGLRAWVGPAIGSCCYEVDEDVAEQVVSASDSGVLAQGPRGKPHVDLPWAVLWQLREAGVEEIRPVPLCTRCEVDWLWSYRREGAGAGRNHAVIWRR
ncbi:MAG: polyphenol oxidase family protein [Acidobacteriota bacterium]